jgi:hypothetical protein
MMAAPGARGRAHRGGVEAAKARPSPGVLIRDVAGEIGKSRRIAPNDNPNYDYGRWKETQ